MENPTGKIDRSEQESQTIEWKWAWQDDYLKWLCGLSEKYYYSRRLLQPVVVTALLHKLLE